MSASTLIHSNIFTTTLIILVQPFHHSISELKTYNLPPLPYSLPFLFSVKGFIVSLGFTHLTLNRLISFLPENSIFALILVLHALNHNLPYFLYFKALLFKCICFSYSYKKLNSVHPVLAWEWTVDYFKSFFINLFTCVCIVKRFKLH